MCGHCAPAYAQRSETVEHPLLPRIVSHLHCNVTKDLDADEKTDTRLDKFFSSPYASQHLDSLLERARYKGSDHVTLTFWSAPGDTKPGFEEAVDKLENGQGQELKLGHVFGPSWTNHWVKAVIKLPDELKELDQPLMCKFYDRRSRS